MLISKELGCWAYISEDISGENSGKRVLVTYIPSPVWLQERWGRYVIAPTLGLAGATSLYFGSQQLNSVALQSALQVAGVALVCTGIYKGFFDPYIHDHAKQIERVRDYLARHRSWTAWSSLFDRRADLAGLGFASSLRVDDYLTPVEQGSFYNAHAACEVSRLDIPGSSLANLSHLYEIGAISRGRYEALSRAAERWSSREDERAKKQSGIEAEYDAAIAEPLAIRNEETKAYHQQYAATPCVAEHSKLQAVFQAEEKAIRARAELDRAIVRAIPASTDRKDPSSRENLERAINQYTQTELARIRAQFQYQEVPLLSCCEEARAKLNKGLAEAEERYKKRTLGPSERRRRMLETTDAEHDQLSPALQSRLQQSREQEQGIIFTPLNFTLHSSIPQKSRDLALIALYKYLEENPESQA